MLLTECARMFLMQHKSRIAKLKRTIGGYDNKTMVLGAIERGGNVRLQVGGSKFASREILHAFIKSKLAEDKSLIVTDDHPSYKGIEDKDTLHATVNYWQKEYVWGIVHTNTLENVWSLLKRSVIGSYHQVSAKHLDRYLDEFEFRFNNRNNSYLFRDTLMRLLQTSNLEYKELTKEKAA